MGDGIYLGLDLHKDFSYMTLMDSGGEVMCQEKVDNTEEAMDRFFSGWDSSDLHVAVESTWNWYWLYEYLEGMDIDVHLVHAERAKAIASAKIKTDKIDSYVLAQMLRTGFLPEAHIASKEARHIRERLRRRQFLVQIRAMLKHQIHSILAKAGKRCPYKTLFAKRSIRWMEGLELAECYREGITSSLKLIKVLTEEVVRIQRWIEAEIEVHPDAKLMAGVPGIGLFTALLVLAEIDGIGRFRGYKSLISYAGLAPSLHQSGTVNRTGPITKRGNKWLRWALIQSAQHATKKGHFLHKIYEQVSRRRGHHKAVTAVAVRLLKIVYYVLKNKMEFDVLAYSRDKRRHKVTEKAGRLGKVSSVGSWSSASI